MKSDTAEYGEIEALNRKDITEDILITDQDSGGVRPVAEVEERGDHPVLSLLDMAVKVGGDYCKKTALPPPNTSVYEHFSKPFLSTALWHYFPDGSIPDDPRVALAAGAGGLALAFAPALMEVYKRKQAEKYGEEPEKEEKRIKNPVTGSEYRVKDGSSRRREERGEKSEYIPALDVETPKDGFESPVWVDRLNNALIPGL
jgi:hypothetical protein